MTEKPILFTPDDAQKVHLGLKTQTRRIAPLLLPGLSKDYIHTETSEEWVKKRTAQAPIQVGDQLWVREAYWKIPEPSERQLRDGADTWPKVAYAAQEKGICIEQNKAMGWKLKPSIHMPRWACRTILEVTAVKAERLQDISEEDAQEEGISHRRWCDLAQRWCFRKPFSDLWSTIHKPDGPNGWKANPWVWAYTFRRLKP